MQKIKIILVLIFFVGSPVLADEKEVRYSGYVFSPTYPTKESNQYAKQLLSVELSGDEWYEPSLVYGVGDNEILALFRSTLKKSKISEFDQLRIQAITNKKPFDMPREWIGMRLLKRETKTSVSLNNSLEDKKSKYWHQGRFNPLSSLAGTSIYGCFNAPHMFQEDMFLNKPPIYGVMTSNEQYYPGKWIEESFVSRLKIINNNGELLLSENMFVNNAKRCEIPEDPLNNVSKSYACPEIFGYFYGSALPSNIQRPGDVEINLTYNFSKPRLPEHQLFEEVYESDAIGRVKFVKLFIKDFDKNGRLDLLFWHRRFVSAKKAEKNPENLRFEKEWFTHYEEVVTSNSLEAKKINPELARNWLDSENMSWNSGWPYNYEHCSENMLKWARVKSTDVVSIGGGSEVKLYY